MRVSAGLPTGMEGLIYPSPFSDPENVIKIAVAAEKLGSAISITFSGSEKGMG